MNARRDAEAFLDFLETQNALDRPALLRVRGAATATNQSVDTVLLELGLINEISLAQYQARFLGTVRATSEDFRDDLLHEAAIPADFLKRSGLAPLSAAPERLIVATARPFESAPARALGYFLGKAVECRVATAREIAAFYKRVDQIDGPEAADPPQDAGDSARAN